mgnify:CR=1 FL=1
MLWFVIALMIVIALAIILLPLLRTAKAQSENRREQNVQIAQEQLKKLKEDREQGLISVQDYEQAYGDLEKTLYGDLGVTTEGELTDSGTAYIMTSILVLLVPMTVITLYYSLGSPTLIGMTDTVKTSETSVATNKDKSKKVSDISSLFESLKQRLEANPDDIQGWMMMGLTYMHYEQFDDALAAYKKADALLPGDSDIQQALDRALKAQSATKEPSSASKVIEKKMQAPNGQTIDVGAMVMRLKAKLEADPDNIQGWMMLGRSYTNLGYHVEAVDAYEKALGLMSDDPEISALLEEAKKLANQPN